MLSKGILFIAFGDDFCELAMKTIHHSRNFTKLPFHVLTNVKENKFDCIDNTTVKYIHSEQNLNRHYKTQMHDYSPFEQTLYIDCDAVLQNEGIEKVFECLEYSPMAFISYGVWENDRHALSYYHKTFKALNETYPIELFYGAFILFKKCKIVDDFFFKWHWNWIHSKVDREMPALAVTIKNMKNFDYKKYTIDNNVFSWILNEKAIIQHEKGNGTKFWLEYFFRYSRKKLMNV